jgi:HK97 family phage portal protein
MLMSSIFKPAFSAGPTYGGAIPSSRWMPLGLDMSTETFAGPHVDEKRAMTITAVFRSVSLISEAVAMLPLVVMQRDGERRERVEDHPLNELFANPNDLMNSVDLRSTTQAHALQYGNGYQNIQRTAAGQPVRLWPLLPDRTRLTPIDGGSGERELVYVTTIDGTQHPVDPADVAHIRGLSFDGIRGYSPIQLAKQGLGLALALEEYGSRFFSNDAKSGGVIQHPGNLSKPAQDRLREAWNAQSGLSRAHLVKVLEEGMEFKPTSIPPEDAQFLMTRTFQVEEVARLYGIPLHMLQSQAKSTSWGSGIAQMSLGFLIYTVMPWLLRWEQELGRKLLTEQERDDGMYLRHNVSALLRSDPVTRSSFYTAALNSATGWMTRAEVRALEDLNPDDIENMTSNAVPFASPPAADEPEEDELEDDESAED